MTGLSTGEFVQILVVLKTNEIDLSKILIGGNNSSKIQDLIKGKDKEEQNKIINELKKISEEITEGWPIGKNLNRRKTRNMEELKKEIEKTGMVLTSEEQQRILEKREQMKRITTREFVQILWILKTNKVDLSQIVQIGKVEDIIKEKNKEEQNKIINELKKISEEITEKWPIGQNLKTQKTRKMEELKKEIEKVGIVLTEQETKVILEKEGSKEKSERSLRELVEVLVVLKKYRIDLSSIKMGNDASIIDDLIREKDMEEQKQIIKELRDISEKITKDWTIGRKLNTQKTNNMVKLKKEIEEAGLEEKLNDKERKLILEKRAKKKVKQTVVEQKNKGELGQNQQIETEVFEETIIQAEQTQETEASVR